MKKIEEKIKHYMNTEAPLTEFWKEDVEAAYKAGYKKAQEEEVLHSKACTWDLGECKYTGLSVTIQTRRQLDGNSKYVVVMAKDWTLCKDGEFRHEPMPSQRGDEYLLQSRFDSPEEAYNFWKENVKGKKDLYY